MKIIPGWLHEFLEIPVDDRKLAEDLTMAGISVESIEGEGAQTVFDVDFTPNRVDAMNHYGVARDCGAVYDRDMKPIAPRLPPAAVSQAALFKIEIEDAQGCARYTARIMRGVKVLPSPEKIARRLQLLDSRPISNVADASNYALQEIGHPTHCFDLDLLEGGKIVIRRARQGEKLKTLDGVERTLHRDDLVIADAVKPVALAGVMGGFDSMITDKTRNVLIESAWFDPGSIRRTARRHGLHTDASHRFERGADVGITPAACSRVAELVLQTAGGQLEGAEIDAYARKIERPTLTLRRSELRRILGQDISEIEVARILRRLGFAVTAGYASSAKPLHDFAAAGSGGAHAAIAEEVESFAVTVPTWRLDVEREIDLIEEVARIYGYDRFPGTLPPFVGGVVEPPEARKEARIRGSLLGLGYNEAISLTFNSREDAAAFAPAAAVEIANPLSETAAVMRTSMVPSMLSMLAYNLNRGNVDVRLFEMGNVYQLAGQSTHELRRLAIGATGAALRSDVHQPGRPYTFYDLKGDIETLLGQFEHTSLYFDAISSDYYHPGRAARAVINGTTVARFGQLHPRLAAGRKIKQAVYLAELDLDRLYRHALRKPCYQPIPRFPAADRDFSFLFDDAVSWEQVENSVRALRIAELQGIKPVEIFRGGGVSPGKYSLLLRVTFQSTDRTLRDDEVALWSLQIIKVLQALGGVQRA